MATRKNLCLIFVIMLGLTIAISVNPVYAQSLSSTPLPLPVAPELSITITNSSYYEPVTYSIDASTGQKIANASYYSGYVDALNITITIKNQPLALSTKSSEYTGFKYFIELKPHNYANWTSLTYSLDGFGHNQAGLGFTPSNTSQTQLTFQFSNPYFPVNYSKEYPVTSSGLTYATNPVYPVTIAKSETVDFRVKAAVGDFSYISMGQLVFNGNYSDWNQLTITMADGETSGNIPSPSVPEFTSLALAPLLAATLLIVLKLKQHKRTATYII